MIYCKNISLSFSNKIIFDNLNLFIEKNKNVCLNGPSGKGKSTLLKLLLGYIMPDSGQLIIKNKVLDTSTIRYIRESISWIPQNINLPVDNGLDLMRLMDISSYIQVVGNFLQKLGLEQDILKMEFDKLSGGQKQRIIISVCLSLDKEIILMDEPTSSLDNTSIELLINTIKSLKGKTILSASHNQRWLNSTDKTIDI